LGDGRRDEGGRREELPALVDLELHLAENIYSLLADVGNLLAQCAGR
jgi:hypothetical protein